MVLRDEGARGHGHAGRRAHGDDHAEAAQADITQLPQLLHGQKTTFYGDKAYYKAFYKADNKLHWEASGGSYRVNKSGKRTAQWDAINAARSRVRARGEHIFRVVKCQWGFTKVRYRALVKNTTRVLATFAPANLYLVRHRLRPQGT